jgi:ferrous iron transport protein A
MSLARTPRDRAVRVSAISGSGPVAQRLMELGFVEGARVEIIGRAPLGDPLHVRLDDYELSLRGADAELVQVGDF